MTHRSAIAGQGGGAAWTPPAGCLSWIYALASGDVAALGTVPDQSGIGYDGTLTSDAYMEGDGADKGLVLAGSSDDMTLGNVTQLSGATAVTLSAWFRREGPSVGLVQRGESVNDRIGAEASGAMLAYVYATRGAFAYASPISAVALPANTWVHVAIVFDGAGAQNADRLKLYVGGSPVALTYTGNVATSLHTGTTPTVWGNARYYAGREWVGRIDDMMVANAAWTANDIADIYANSPGSHAT